MENEKPKLDNVRRLRASTFVILKTKMTNKLPRMRGEKLEVQMDAAMPCKKKNKKPEQIPGNRSEAQNTVPKTKYACIMEAQDNEWNHLLQKITKTTLHAKDSLL